MSAIVLNSQRKYLSCEYPYDHLVSPCEYVVLVFVDKIDHTEDTTWDQVLWKRVEVKVRVKGEYKSER